MLCVSYVFLHIYFIVLIMCFVIMISHKESFSVQVLYTRNTFLSKTCSVSMKEIFCCHLKAYHFTEFYSWISRYGDYW